MPLWQAQRSHESIRRWACRACAKRAARRRGTVAAAARRRAPWRGRTAHADERTLRKIELTDAPEAQQGVRSEEREDAVARVTDVEKLGGKHRTPREAAVCGHLRKGLRGGVPWLRECVDEQGKKP